MIIPFPHNDAARLLYYLGGAVRMHMENVIDWVVSAGPRERVPWFTGITGGLQMMVRSEDEVMAVAAIVRELNRTKMIFACHRHIVEPISQEMVDAEFKRRKTAKPLVDRCEKIDSRHVFWDQVLIRTSIPYSPISFTKAIDAWKTMDSEASRLIRRKKPTQSQ